MKTKAIALILLVGIFFLSSCRKEKNRICELYDGEVGYAIGTIYTYKHKPFKAFLNYSYTIDGVLYESREKIYGIGLGDDRVLDLSFVVVYSLENPNCSDLNRDYYIEDQDDFTQFLEDYQDIPPPPDYPNKCN